MTHTAWKSRERKRVWMENLQLWAGGLLLGAGIMAFFALMLQLDSLVVLK